MLDTAGQCWMLEIWVIFKISYLHNLLHDIKRIQKGESERDWERTHNLGSVGHWRKHKFQMCSRL